MNVRLTDSARADLLRIGDWLAVTDPEHARLTVRALRSAARSIGEMPYVSSPLVHSPGIRKKSFRPYVLLFTVQASEVLILRIAHERSDWASLV